MTKLQTKSLQDPASFRDPSGFIFHYQNQLYRQINHSYQADFQSFMDSGLYHQLTQDKLLVSHQQTKIKPATPEGFLVIKPDPIPFISYPYEWSFSQLKAAALLTLRLHQLALKHNFQLKDASSFNVQFIGTRPIFIDTLSFQPYRQNQPWVAYRQFCRHFLAPLALMSRRDMHLNNLLRLYIDGLPLDLVSQLLPTSSKLNFGLLAHLHANAASQKTFSTRKSPSNLKLSKSAHQNLINNLESTVQNIKPKLSKTEWSHYYQETNYSDQSFARKKTLVSQYLKKIKPKTVLDLGANTGEFSLISTKLNALTISTDIDPLAVEFNYQQNHPNPHLLPLVIDLTNPSPALGWDNTERSSFLSRTHADVVLSLALIHHLCIANNLPFSHVARTLSLLGTHHLIEFVPKSDSQCQRLLKAREDIFDHYTQTQFESVFSKFFVIKDKAKITGTQRTLYQLKSNHA